MINEGTITQLGCIEKAKELGFDVIEFIDLIPHDGSTEKEYAKKIANECERVGIEIGSYTISADLLNGSDGDTKKEIARIKEKLDVAKILGVKKLRHDATAGIRNGKFKSFDAVLETLVEACHEITTYAKSLGIKTMVENHGFFAQDSARVEKLVNGVDDENFGVLLDMGNFLCADESPQDAVGVLAPYAIHVHAKDFHVKSGMDPCPGDGWFKTRGGNYLRGAIIGHGEVPVVQCLGIIKKAGYDDTISIEFEGLEENIKALKIGISNLKRYIEMA
jgi:sugar phosphate isomerase/epimerase